MTGETAAADHIAAEEFPTFQKEVTHKAGV
jgi:hypothetical protein